MTTLGTRLKQSRVAHGWTQADLSRKSGVSVVTISHFENGRRTPKLPNAVKLAKALGVTMDWLVSGGKGLPCAGKARTRAA